MQAEIQWTENGEPHSARWQSEAGNPPPKRVQVADDTMNADTAYRLACEGTALLWRGDFHNARQLLQALARRADHKHGKGKKARPAKVPASMTEAFNLHRQAQAQRARVLAMLLIPVEPGYVIPLRRAPEIKLACNEAYGRGEDAFVVSLRELQGLVGAHEWRRVGVPLEALGDKIHPHYGVFSPVRGEYVQLVADAPLPPGAKKLAFDIGVGTGVLSAVLARRGVERVVATDMDQRALSCARDNFARLDLQTQVELVKADLFPEGRAPLVVCNPPWVPARPSSPIEHAIFDPDSRMLRGFLSGLKEHLTPTGEGWLILSDLAEHLGLRPREQLMEWIATAGLKVVDRMDARPVHPKAADDSDPLHVARSAEVTSLWRLAAA